MTHRSLFKSFCEVLSNAELNEFKLISSEPSFESFIISKETPNHSGNTFLEQQVQFIFENKMKNAFDSLNSFKSRAHSFLSSNMASFDKKKPKSFQKLSYPQVILDFFFKPSCSMPYLRRESPFESRDSFQLHALDMQTLEDGTTFPGSSQQFQTLFSQLIDQPAESSNHGLRATSGSVGKQGKYAGFFGGNGSASFFRFDPQETAQIFHSDSSYRTTKMTGHLSEEMKCLLQIIRWNTYSSATSKKFESFSNKVLSRGEKVIMVFLMMRWAAEVFCTFFQVYLEMVLENSSRDWLLLLTLYCEGFKNFTIAIEKIDREMNLFNNELQHLYEASFPNENTMAYETFAQWKGLARIWEARVYVPLKEYLLAGFRQTLDLVRLQKLEVISKGKDTRSKESQFWNPFKANEHMPDCDFDEKKHRPLVKYYKENSSSCVFLVQEFVNSAIDLGINEVTIFRIGNSSRSLPLSKYLVEIESIFFDHSKLFYEKCFDALLSSNSIDLLPSLLQSEYHMVNSAFPRCSFYLFLEKIHGWALDFCQSSFGMKAFGSESDFLFCSDSPSPKGNDPMRIESETVQEESRMSFERDTDSFHILDEIQRILVCSSINIKGKIQEKWEPVQFQPKFNGTFKEIYSVYSENKLLKSKELEEVFKVSHNHDSMDFVESAPEWEGVTYDNNTFALI